ncbi:MULTISPECIES: hypothetical protein [Pseudomonas]|uniref:hypothetical protein n=1 Tax=Pseudomonas TaxID=286 RepID=UPI0030DD6919
MTNKSIIKFPLKYQASKDFLKLFALFEKITITFLSVFIAFFLTIKIEMMTSTLISTVAIGALTISILVAKKMYDEQALSKLTISTKIDPIEIERQIMLLNYKRVNNGIYSSNKKLFSFFFSCKSELITLNKHGNNIELTGPYNKILDLSKALAYGEA